jgi:hypothetical protein
MLLNRDKYMKNYMTLTITANHNKPSTRAWIAKGFDVEKPSDVSNETLGGLLTHLTGSDLPVKFINRGQCKVICLNAHGEVKTIMYDYMTYSSSSIGGCVGFYLRGSVDGNRYTDIDDERIAKDGYEYVSALGIIQLEEIEKTISKSKRLSAVA